MLFVLSALLGLLEVALSVKICPLEFDIMNLHGR